MTDTPILKVEKLVKSFPQRRSFFGNKKYLHAVNGVTFSIRAGETLGLVGESGCGKSTVGKSIMKLHEPSSGRIVFEGQDIASLGRSAMKPIRRRVQTIFQDPFASLNPRMTAGAIVAEPLTIHGLASGAEKWQITAEIFQKVGLRADQMSRFPHEFSGGQRQRLSIARALIVNPELIVADEPVSALDVSIQASVINLLVRLQKEMGLSLLFISHDMSVIEHVSHRIAVMYLGHIVENAPRDLLFSNPRHPYTKALMSAVPVPNPNSRDKRRIALKGDVPSPIGPPSGCPFRTRCPLSEDICATAAPPLREDVRGHAVACHIPAPELVG